MDFATNTTVVIVHGERLQQPFVARTTNGGMTWTEGVIDSISNNSLLICGKLLSPLVGYLCGGGGFASPAVMLHRTNGGVTTVDRLGTHTMQTHALYQNYPNPFNPSTTISFSLPSESLVSLKVFDALGREVATLVHEGLPAGVYSAEWNAVDFTSGVYYYQLRAGNFVQTKKLVLIR